MWVQGSGCGGSGDTTARGESLCITAIKEPAGKVWVFGFGVGDIGATVATVYILS